MVSETEKANSKSQTMLRGIAGDKLEQITRDVPFDEPPALPENAKLSAIGKSVHRFDAAEKVTGRARYTFDVQLPGMLYAQRVVSTMPHARIKSIDTSAAEKYPGVRAVHILERDLMQAQLRDSKVEARSRYPMVRYAGQPLGAVAAETQRAADAAAKLVRIEYEVLPHVSNLEEAMRPDAPPYFPDLR
jgi:xanthine dehydrogenase YagR molybdenum-binding subunit